MARTVNSDSVAQDQLRAFIDRIERMEEEKKAIADDIKEIYSEAKGNGLDTKVLRQIIRIRKQDHAERMEQEALLDLYMSALGMQVAPRDRDDDDDEPATRRANLSSERAPSVAEPSLHNPQTTIRPDKPADTDDRGAHALSSGSNSAIPPADQTMGGAPPALSVVDQSQSESNEGKPVGLSPSAGGETDGVASRASVGAGTDAFNSADESQPLRSGREEASRLAHNQEIAGSSPAPATSSQAPSIASVNAPPQSVANDANAGGDDDRRLRPMTGGATNEASPAPSFSSKPRDGVYSADWLRRHGHCQQLDTCAVEPGRLCRECSLALAATAVEA